MVKTKNIIKEEICRIPEKEMGVIIKDDQIPQKLNGQQTRHILEGPEKLENNNK